MKGPRPLRLMIGSLALAGLVKAGLSLGLFPVSAGEDAPALFLTAAHASAGNETVVAPQTCEQPEEIFDAIRIERDLLAQQKQELAQRSSEVALSVEKLNIETARLVELKNEVETLLTRVAQSHTNDVERLVALYRNMKPKEAAGIMNDMDLEVTVIVLSTMAERDAAPILARLTPVRAQAISRIILERSKLPGDQRLNGVPLN